MLLDHNSKLGTGDTVHVASQFCVVCWHWQGTWWECAERPHKPLELFAQIILNYYYEASECTFDSTRLLLHFQRGEREHPQSVLQQAGWAGWHKAGGAGWGGNCLLHYIFSCISSSSPSSSHLVTLWLRLVLEHKCCIRCSPSLFHSHCAQHVAFLAHLERISPFTDPPSRPSLHWYALPCHGGGFSFSFSHPNNKPVRIRLGSVPGRIRQLLFL